MEPGISIFKQKNSVWHLSLITVHGLMVEQVWSLAVNGTDKSKLFHRVGSLLNLLMLWIAQKWWPSVNKLHCYSKLRDKKRNPSCQIHYWLLQWRKIVCQVIVHQCNSACSGSTKWRELTNEVINGLSFIPAYWLARVRDAMQRFEGPVYALQKLRIILFSQRAFVIFWR